MPGFATYRIRDHIGREPVESFDDVIDFDRWSEQITDQIEIDSPVPAKLYLVRGSPGGPSWLDFLRQGFGDDVNVRHAPAPGALLVVRVRHRRKDAYLAFAFGIGRYLMRDNAYVRNFGLRVALNTVFEGDQGTEDFDTSRLRNVVSRRPSANPLRMQGQSGFNAALEQFDLDLDRDLLSGVTGEPQDKEHWGTRVSGSDALHFNVALGFDDLEARCKDLLKVHDKKDYKTRFSFIDEVGRVADPELIEELTGVVVDQLRSGEPGDFELTVPQLVEWERVQKFSMPYERAGSTVRRPELRLRDYLSVLAREERLADLDVELLRRNKIQALDSDDQVSYPWSAWRCLSGEFTHGSQVYVLDDGDFFAVEPDYLHALDDFLRHHVPESELVLPDGKPGMHEETYNRLAGEEQGLLVLDRKTVRASRSTSAIEVCDLLSPERHLVHVKRNLGSSLLSHLFAQGSVSADLLLSNDDFRRQAAAKVSDVLDEAGDSVGDRSRFEVFSSGLDPTKFEVVYAVVADWQGKDLVDRLPFFSKVNLRRCVQDLRLRRFRVTHKRVQTL